MANVTMKAKDTLSASLAECFATINGRRYNLFNMTKFEAKFKKNKQKVAILGKTGKGNKASGWEGTFSGTMHYNTSVFRKIAEEYKSTGNDVYFDIQVTNEDPQSSAGRQTVIFIDCNLDEMILAKFDASSDGSLEEDISGTFDDFKYPESFKLLEGM